MAHAYLRRIYWQLTGAILVVILLALAGLSYATHRAFEQALVPEMARKAATVGNSVGALMDKAQGYGIGFRDLYGVEASFKEVVDRYADYAYMAATDPQGAIVFRYGEEPPGAAAHLLGQAGRTPLALTAGEVPFATVGRLYLVSLPLAAGALHIGIERSFVQKLMLEAVLDIIVVLVVSLFFTLELLNFTAGVPLARGLRAFMFAIERVKGGDFTQRPRLVDDEVGRVLAHLDSRIACINAAWLAAGADLRARLNAAEAAARAPIADGLRRWEALRARFAPGTTREADDGALARIRAPLFVFILAEELTRSFLPSYAQQLLVPLPGIAPEVVIGLPIMLFMLIVALGQPMLGAWSERVGRRHAMLVGAAVGVAGFAATAMAHSLLDLLVWRALCAVGYAIVFVAAQGYVLDHASPDQRTRAFALFIGAIMVATVCGPSIGGILADNVGPRPAFLVSAVLCAIAVLVIGHLPRDSTAIRIRRERPPTVADAGRLMVNGRFMALTGLAAIPAKMVLIGVCFYLVPLYVVSIGGTGAMAGRLLMVYAVLMVLFVPLAAQLAGKGVRPERLVAAGLCISGLGGLALPFVEATAGLIAVVVLLGLGQAMSISAQSALVGDLCAEEIRRFGEGAVYGVYRMLERFGNALGPLLAALLVSRYGYRDAFVGMSFLVVAGGAAFFVASESMRRGAAAGDGR